VFRILFLSHLLLIPAAGYALTNELGPDLTEKSTVLPARPELSEKMQAFLDEIKSSEAALEKAREYQKNDQFGLAKLVLQHGIELARSSGSDIIELTNELEYDMPMLQAKQLLVTGMPNQAETILQRLKENFISDKKRTDEITALHDALQESRFLAAVKRDAEQNVTRDVRKRMSGYYKLHGVFPTYEQLNQLLPIDDKVLQNYEIIYFKSVPNAYRMVLRNYYNKKNLLKIEATGLIK
jgi:hypothetical protein